MAPALSYITAVLMERTNYGLGGRGQSLVLVSVLMPLISLVLVVNRVFWRVHGGHVPLLADDWCIIAAVVFVIAMSVCNVIAVDHGYSRHMKSLLHDDLIYALKMFWMNQILYKFAINLTKVSILFLYKRIFIDRNFPKRCYMVVTCVVLYSIASIIATLLECTPMERIYNKSVPGTCINLTAFWYSNAVYSIVTDLIILILPMPIIFKLTGLNKPAKINLGIVFSLGLFVCVTSILRMTTLNVSSKAPDQTYGTYRSTIWTTVEANAAITAACLPMIRTLISNLFPQWFANTRYGRTTSLGNSQIQTNGGRNRIAATRRNPTTLQLPTPHEAPGPIELNRLRNMPRPTPADDSKPYMVNTAGYPLSKIRPHTSSRPNDMIVKMDNCGSVSTDSKSESHEETESPQRK